MSDGTSTSPPADRAPGQSAGAHPAATGPAAQVRFDLPAVPANVALVRQALAGLADSLGVEAARAADMKIALTEACTNAVVHAYGEDGGPLEVSMHVEHGRLVLTVRDRGPGLRPLPSSGEGPPLGFGLALIASLSDEFGLVGGRHGTEVRIAFGLDGETEPPPLAVQLTAGDPPPQDGLALALAPGDHAPAVLGRVVSLVAARADFSIDRLSDAQIVSDAIAGAAGAHALRGDGSVCVSIDEQERSFDLLIGPLAAGGARRLIEDTELPGVGVLLERLADELEVDAAPAGGERLRARFDARD